MMNTSFTLLVMASGKVNSNTFLKPFLGARAGLTSSALPFAKAVATPERPNSRAGKDGSATFPSSRPLFFAQPGRRADAIKLSLQFFINGSAGVILPVFFRAPQFFMFAFYGMPSRKPMVDQAGFNHDVA